MSASAMMECGRPALMSMVMGMRDLAKGSQQCQVFKIDDPNMPADFLTKWLPQAKLRDSVAYATNSRKHACMIAIATVK